MGLVALRFDSSPLPFPKWPPEPGEEAEKLSTEKSVTQHLQYCSQLYEVMSALRPNQVNYETPRETLLIARSSVAIRSLQYSSRGGLSEKLIHLGQPLVWQVTCMTGMLRTFSRHQCTS